MAVFLKRMFIPIALVVLNYIILTLLVGSTALTSLHNLVTVIILSFVIGYLTRMSELPLAFLEGLALASVVVIGRIVSWASIRSAGEITLFSILAYGLGLLTRGKDLKTGFTFFKPSLNKFTLINTLVKISAFSTSALISYISLSFFKMFFINVLTITLYFINVAVFLTYSTWVLPPNIWGTKYRVLFNISLGILLTFSPITQPLLTFFSIDYLESIRPVSPCLYIGSSLVRRVSGSRTRYNRLCVLTKHMENNHIIVVGASGTGKTTLVKKLVTEALKSGKFKIIVLDVHGEYSDIPHAHVIRLDVERPNIFSRLGKPPEIRAEELASLIADIYKLGEQQRYVLQQVLLHT